MTRAVATAAHSFETLYQGVTRVARRVAAAAEEARRIDNLLNMERERSWLRLQNRYW